MSKGSWEITSDLEALQEFADEWLRPIHPELPQVMVDFMRATSWLDWA